jgi:hypothetical protein
VILHVHFKAIGDTRQRHFLTTTCSCLLQDGVSHI